MLPANSQGSSERSSGSVHELLHERPLPARGLGSVGVEQRGVPVLEIEGDGLGLLGTGREVDAVVSGLHRLAFQRDQHLPGEPPTAVVGVRPHSFEFGGAVVVAHEGTARDRLLTLQ